MFIIKTYLLSLAHQKNIQNSIFIHSLQKLFRYPEKRLTEKI